MTRLSLLRDEEEEVFDKITNYYNDLQLLARETNNKIDYAQKDEQRVLSRLRVKKARAEESETRTQGKVRYLELLIQAKECYYDDLKFRIQRLFEEKRKHLEEQIEKNKLKMKKIQDKIKMKLEIQEEQEE